MYINDILALVKSLWLWEEYVTVLFSVNTEKVHLRKESVLEVCWEPKEELWCRELMLACHEHGLAPPKSDSMHPRRACRWMGLAKAMQPLAEKKIKSHPKDQKVGVSWVVGAQGVLPTVFLQPAFNYLADKCEQKPFTTTASYGRKRKFWSISEGDQVCHPLASFLGCTTGSFVGVFIPLGLGS